MCKTSMKLSVLISILISILTPFQSFSADSSVDPQSTENQSNSKLTSDGKQNQSVERIPLISIFTEVPKTSWETLKDSFDRDSLLPWSVILASTWLTYRYDAEILQNVQYSGRKWDLGNSDNTKNVLSYKQYNLIRLPADTGSWMYFLGDGWTHSLIASSFFLSGALAQSGNKAWNTGVQIIHGMITSTIFSQALKRSTGRESPTERTEPRGAWRPFPSVNAYSRKTARYDAFPSGHIMTATMTFTVIHQNYPEYWYLTLPIEGIWLTALGYQMINNGVHWASDYPLGIAMGYQFGKFAARMGRPKNTEKKDVSQWMIFPGEQDSTQTLNLAYFF